jgi:hypothetical protein
VIGPQSDPFVSMARSGKMYGFAMALQELPNTAPRLFRVVSEYRNAHSISSTPMWKAMVDASWVPWPFRLLLRSLKGRGLKETHEISVIFGVILRLALFPLETKPS